MGQAKNRGTFEERREAAIARDAKIREARAEIRRRAGKSRTGPELAMWLATGAALVQEGAGNRHVAVSGAILDELNAMKKS